MAYAADAIRRSRSWTHTAGRCPSWRAPLLVDRFVLVGTQLQPKREVRYQRSRSRTRPAGRTDSLGAADLNKVPFVEPTQNLRFVPSITEGRFAAVLVPTQVAEVFRWQLFTHDAAGDVVWCYSIERTSDGLFDTRGTQPLTCTDHPDVYAADARHLPASCGGRPDRRCAARLLVARLPDGGASRTALAFPADGSGVVTLDGAGATGTEFTVEAWLAPDVVAAGERALVTCAGDRQDGRAVDLGARRPQPAHRIRRRHGVPRRHDAGAAGAVHVEPPGRDLRCWTFAGICQWHSSVRLVGLSATRCRAPRRSRRSAHRLTGTAARSTTSGCGG